MDLGRWDWLLLGIFLLFLIYLYLKRIDAYFAKRGVKRLSDGYFPILSDLYHLLSRTEHMKDTVQRAYDSFPEERFVGFHTFPRPMIIVKDIELIKQITVMDFDHFTDHLGIPEPENDPLFGSNLIALRGEKWKEMRATLSPAFTSSKMRGMFQFIVDCGEQMTEFYIKQMNKPEYKEKGMLELEMKDAFTRYTNDVIATCAFGLKVNSLEEPNNEFYMMGKDATNLSGIVMLKIFLIQMFPNVMKFFDATFFPKRVGEFFRSRILGTMKDREEQHIVRADMVQILMDVKKGVLKHEVNHVDGEDKETGFATVEESHIGKTVIRRQWTDDELVAQAIIFFVAGFETVGSLLRFATYELVRNPHLQKRLQQEVDAVTEEGDGKLKYADLQNMKYMDMFISEVLRFWPPNVFLDRRCAKPYKMPSPNLKSDREVEILAGHALLIPVFSIQHDPKYYKDPETFDPERFSDENKKDIHPFTYLPFGTGPRNCIGSRFALMEVKSVIFHLLRKFDLVVTTKTEIPVKIRTDDFNLNSLAGFWIGLKPRITST